MTVPIVLLVSLALCYTGVEGKTGSPGSTIPNPKVDSPNVPDDVSIPPGFTGNPIAFFDDYSWRAFIAVVWLGLKDKQGVPDTTQTVDGVGPRIFETYKSLAEVFHNDGSAPAPLDMYDPPMHNPCGVNTEYGDMTLGSFSKFSNSGHAGFGTLVGPLVAQNSTYVRYLTGFNNKEFQQIVDQKWYLRKNVPSAPSSITFVDGALDVAVYSIERAALLRGQSHSFLGPDTQRRIRFFFEKLAQLTRSCFATVEAWTPSNASDRMHAKDASALSVSWTCSLRSGTRSRPPSSNSRPPSSNCKPRNNALTNSRENSVCRQRPSWHSPSRCVPRNSANKHAAKNPKKNGNVRDDAAV